MNNDKRWILPTLMSVAHLGSEYALARRLLLLDSRLKLAGQPRRGKLGKCGGMRGIHRLDQSIHALPVQCRYRVHFGKRQETPLAFEFAQNAFPPFTVQAVPFLNHPHHPPTSPHHTPPPVPPRTAKP